MFEIIAAADAVSNALAVLEEHASADEEWQEGIRRHVFPLVEERVNARRPASVYSV